MTARAARARTALVAVLGMAALVCGTGWAFATILLPAPAIGANDGYTTVEAVEGEVGAHLTLNVAAQWSSSPVAMNEAAGVVTSVDAVAGQPVSQGGRLYSVDEHPVVAARGQIPAYRAITAGDSGDDVRQLQSMLADGGYFAGEPAGSASTGVVDSVTVDAIERWQQASGEVSSGGVLSGNVPSGGEARGTVAYGEVVFVPDLPARLALATDIVRRGATLGGGEPAILGLGDVPEFTLPVGESQSALIPNGTRVDISGSGGDTWHALAAGRSTADAGTVVISLTGDGGGSVCGTSCDGIPVGGQTLLPASVITVPTVRGTIVPSIALRTDAAHTLSVLDDSGVTHPVAVAAEAQGMSVVTGIDPGLRVRIPSPAGASGAGRADRAGGS
ncbi:peptidoglycan-binding domain-containing protein [Subtercola vilae]|uniref:Peptidoglycan-binding protein n=1 Tax=Subtercola vilae TaxID=2056433 RepID=A0A4T2BNN3_9MICO|nr:peptidoglycan-binding domain-containing protein [Subtercola vilae]TIH33313.1 peptidoglycan-binding protein [Subtercola vilae]